MKITKIISIIHKLNLLKKTRVSCFIFVVIYSAREVRAVDFNKNRPGFISGSSIINESGILTESGYTYLIKNNERIHNIGELKIRIGVNDIFEAIFGINSYKIVSSNDNLDDETGKDDPYLGLKLKINDYNKSRMILMPEFAINFGAQYGTGTTNLKKGNVKPEAKLILAWPFSNQFYTSVNLNYSYITEDDIKFNQISTGISLGSDISKFFSIFIEFYFFFPESTIKNNTQYVKSGIIVSPFRNIHFDLHFGKSIDNTYNEFYMGGGVVVRKN